MAKEVDEVGMCAWSDDEVVAEEVVATPIQQPVPIKVTYDERNPFIDAYNVSIKKTKDSMMGQWRECIRDKKTLDIQAPSTSDEVYSIFTLVVLIIVCMDIFCS